MINLPTDLPRKYRYAYRVTFFAGQWQHSYELVGAKGGLSLGISGPHVYDGMDHWGAGLETHSRTPLYGDEAPNHDECWLLKCPCWHDGTSLYAQEVYLPLALAGAHDRIFRLMVRDADEKWAIKCDDGEAQ